MKKLENIPKTVKISYQGGSYLFKLGKLLHDSDISVNQLISEIETEYKVIAKYIYGDLISKIDMRIIAKLCRYFQCGIQDIIEFIPDPK